MDALGIDSIRIAIRFNYRRYFSQTTWVCIEWLLCEADVVASYRIRCFTPLRFFVWETEIVLVK